MDLNVMPSFISIGPLLNIVPIQMIFQEQGLAAYNSNICWKGYNFIDNLMKFYTNYFIITIRKSN